MSIRTFNPKTGTWDKKSTMLASSIQVIDTNAKFTSQNVEGCLNEVANDVSVLKDDVKYIYENGTIGGGGGGGGSMPSVTIDGETEYVVNSDDVLDIFYYFKSPNPGYGIAHLSFGKDNIKEQIPQGRNRWTVGPFGRGVHTLSITAEDKQGFWSDSAKVTVVSGSIEITSNFDDSYDFTLNDDIVIPFEVHSALPETVLIDLTLNGKTTTIPANIGANEWRIGKLPFMGVSNASIKAHTETYESNILSYTLVASNSDDLFVSTTFNEETVQQGNRLMLDYRISMKGQYEFFTDLYINGNKSSTVMSKPGVNFWNVGTDLELGQYTFRIVARTVDNMNEAEVSIQTEVVTAGYEPFKPVTVGLVAEFNANGKLNNSLDKDVWETKNDSGISCKLHNFNFVTNGWLDNALKFNGKTYAEIDYKPFKDGIKIGHTFEVLYKTNNVGDIDGKVIHCRNPLTPFQGLSIDTQTALFATKNSEIVSGQFQEDRWTRETWVVDRSTRTLKIYTNAVLSGFVYLKPNGGGGDGYEDEFTYDGKIILGAARDLNGDIVNNSSSEIKVIRIYDRALTNEEILQNHIADIKDRDEQLEIRALNYGETTIPSMKIVGNLENFGEGEKRVVQIDYEDPKDPSRRIIKDGCLLSWQGTSSRDYPVKNYTIELRENGLPFVDYKPKANWKGEDRWTLKANYMDSSHSHNIGTNKFIYDFFEQFPNPSQITDPTTRSNVDGFPMKMLINNEEVGLYTWNIDRYSHNNYGFIKYEEDGSTTRHPTAVSYEIGVNSTDGAGAFNMNDPDPKKRWASIRSEFKHRYNYNGDEEHVTEILPPNIKVLSAGMHNELVSFVDWVTFCTEAEFYAELKEHMSIRHTIDYFLIAYTLGLTDNLGKNMVLSTWGRNEDGDTIWYPSFYDCDTMLGLANDGKIKYGPGIDMDTGDFNTSNSRLWVMLKKMFNQEITDRYRELRMERNLDGLILPPHFSTENLMSYYGGQVTETIGQTFYNQDAELKYLIDAAKDWTWMCSGDRRQYTERWIRERLIYMDSIYEFTDFTIPRITLRSNVTGRLQLRFKTYSPQHIYVSFSDSASAKVKQYVDKDRWYTFEADVSNGTENNITILGAANIMYVDGIKSLNASTIAIGHALKLVELDCSGSNHIQKIELGNNTYLQDVNCSKCPRLGEKVADKVLNLEACINLRKLDCSDTKLGSIKLNSDGGVLEELNCNDTGLTTFLIAGQEYLTNLRLNNCKDLAELSVDNCNGLERIEMPNTVLNKFSVTGCDNLNYIDISNTKKLNRLDLRGCPNLATLKMAGVSNPQLLELDLSNSLNLTHLDVSSNSYLKHIVFGRYLNDAGTQINYNKLNHFNVANSTVETIRYGTGSAIPSYLDLAGFTINYLTFENCTNLKAVKNINYVASGSSTAFKNCQSLVSLEGNLTLRDSISTAFYNCNKLDVLPNFDLTNVTTMSETFYNCDKFTLADAANIFQKVSGNLTSQWRCFNGCNGIVGTVPSTFFNKAVNLTTTNQFFIGTGLTGEIHKDLLKPMTKLTDAGYMFQSTQVDGGSIGLHEDLFRYNTALINTHHMFYDAPIKFMPPENIFKYNRNLQNTFSMFYHCGTMVGTLSDKLFANNPNIHNIGNMFGSCPGVVGEIPPNIFKNIPKDGNGNNKLRHVYAFIADTGIIGSIPVGLFSNMPLLEDVSSFFSGLTGLTGTIPTDIFKYNNRLNKAASVFYSCRGLMGNIPPQLFKGKTILAFASNLFAGCGELSGEIPKGFLNDCTALAEVHGMFSGCRNITGEIPKRVSTFEEVPNPENPDVPDIVEHVSEYGLLDNCAALTNINAMFNGCTKLRSEIPPKFLMNARRVTNANYMFQGCYQLYGPIPEGLFDNCMNLQYAEQMFSDCVGLGELIIDDDNPYCIPNTLFHKCYNLISTDSFLEMVGNPPHGSRLKGAMPPDLFKFNAKLANINRFFWGTPPDGEIPSEFFNGAPKLRYAYNTFAGTNITSLGSSLFNGHKYIENLEGCFSGCDNLTGDAPELWNSNASNGQDCFNGCTGLANYAQIPNTWK